MAELSEAPPWFPDWSGAIVAVIASGPSAKKTHIPALRGKAKILAIKDNLELAPWADVVYGCDAAWWRMKRGLPEFTGLKIAWGGDNSHPPYDAPDIERIRICPWQQHHKRPDRPLFDEAGLVGCGGNSGFQAVNLAAQFGAKRIILVGFDMHDKGGVHWFGRNNTGHGLTNPDETNFRRWRAAFAGSASTFAAHGIEIVNVSPNSAVTCFPKRSIERTLSDWGIA